MSLAGRAALVAGVAAVVAMVVALFLAARQAGEPHAPSSAATGTDPENETAKERPSVPGTEPRGSDLAAAARARPPVHLPVLDPRALGGPGKKESIPAPEAGGEPPPPAGSRIAGSTMGHMRTTLGPIVRTCAAPLREMDPPPHGAVTVSSTLHMAAGRITARDVDVDYDFIGTAQGDAFVQCVKSAVSALDTVSPPDQSDGDEPIHLMFVAP